MFLAALAALAAAAPLLPGASVLALSPRNHRRPPPGAFRRPRLPGSALSARSLRRRGVWSLSAPLREDYGKYRPNVERVTRAIFHLRNQIPKKE